MINLFIKLLYLSLAEFISKNNQVIRSEVIMKFMKCALLLICSSHFCFGQNEKSINSGLSATTVSMIAFVSKRDGNSEIYTINSNGTELKRITNNTFEDTSPSWSPDGKYIAFISDREKKTAIYIMKADGTNVRRIS
jgi:dipeptidyl aminopeptidase/acylaminoacyl peptidase